MKDNYSFEDFTEIMKTLISENGCPWDKVQTHESLKRCLIEECYEVLDAIDNNDKENLCEELGDVLLQVVFHSRLAENDGEFTINDVINGISQKMIRRHPHIFGNENADTPDDVMDNWEEIKKVEKKYSSATDTLKSVPASFPALLRADKVQKKASKVGIGIENVQDGITKIQDALEELKLSINGKNDRIMENIGDLLFATTNISEFLKINPEFALTNATEKFINRFEYIENTLINQQKSMKNTSAEELNVLWNEPKGTKKL